jgi:hypothetical protein
VVVIGSVIVLTAPINPIIRSRTRYYSSRNPGHVTYRIDRFISILQPVQETNIVISKSSRKTKTNHVTCILINCGPGRRPFWSSNNTPTSDFKSIILSSSDWTAVLSREGHLELSQHRNCVSHCKFTYAN